MEDKGNKQEVVEIVNKLHSGWESWLSTFWNETQNPNKKTFYLSLLQKEIKRRGGEGGQAWQQRNQQAGNNNIRLEALDSGILWQNA